MGIHNNINFDHFPRQGQWLGKSCEVCFNYDPTRTLKAVCVRDDEEEPRLTIFRLEDGRHVLATECMHTMPK